MISLERIIEITAEHFNMQPETVSQGYGYRAILSRQIAVLMCRNLGPFRNRDIARHMRQDKRVISYSYITIKKKLKKNEHFGTYKIKSIVKSIYQKVLEEMEKDPDIDRALVKMASAGVQSQDKSEIPS